MDSRYKRLMTVGGVCLGALLAPAAHAASVSWVGTANYTAASGATGDEDTVGAFSSYDFSSGGMVLIRPTSVAGTGFTVGDTYTGFYQAVVASHVLGSKTVASPNLNTTGSGSGYELTIGANFDERVISVDAFGNPTFEVTGGTASVYFDTTPDMNVTAGTGFTDGDAILTGNIIGGGGTFLTTAGVGVSSISLAITPSGFDPAVFDPATLAGGQGVFTLQANPGLTSQVTGVLGNQVASTDLVLTADGNLDLMAVPLPAPVWLLGMALAGLGVVARRNRSENGSDDNSNGLTPAAA